MQPAHLTKPFLNDGSLNGSALWLSAQALALSLPSLLPNSRKGKRRAIELGSGTGFTALALCSLGWDVVATDTRQVLSSVLQKNIDSNRAALPQGSGTIQARELDWTVDPEKWTWSHPTVIGSHDFVNSDALADTLGPPFDLILTADTIYSPELIEPLLRALHTLSLASFPPVYLALERRDSRLTDDALRRACTVWSFTVRRIPGKRITRAIVKAGCAESGWDGVEIWRLCLRKELISEHSHRCSDL